MRTKCSPLHMACLKSLVLMFHGKNQKQWGAMHNIGWPSHCHVHAHWTMWKHWSLHGLWDKQYHWMFHTSFTRWFMNLVLLDLLFPSWYMNWLSIHYCCFTICAYPKIFTPWINVETPMMDLVIPCGYCVSYCRFVDGGALTSATCSNQDTQTLIESYHGALKHWSSLETKGLRGQWVNWLVWRLTTMVARQYTWLKWRIASL